MRTSSSFSHQSPDALNPDPIRAAIDRVVTTGPTFLEGRIDADSMANTMVAAVRSCSDRQATGGGGHPNPQLQAVLSEIYGCGSGYLAGYCDGACVARTITALVNEFGETAEHRN